MGAICYNEARGNNCQDAKGVSLARRSAEEKEPPPSEIHR